MKFRYLALKTLMMIAAAGSMIACGKSNDGSRTRGADSSVSALTSQMSTCSNGQNAVGVVYTGQQSMQTEVQALVSASINPSFFGYVSGMAQSPDRTGVDIRARLKMVNGQLVTTGSVVQLAIYDEYVGQPSQANPGTTIQPYTITMTQAVSANNSQIVFQDQYGTLTLTFESRDPQKIQGTISFQNNSNVAGGTPMSGTLGSFALPSCVLTN